MRQVNIDAERVTSQSVLVIGGTGGVGEGIVDALLEHGRFARVIVSSRDEARLAAFGARRDAHQKLVTVQGGVDDLDAARALLEAARSHGPLSAVVASLGGWWEGPPLTGLDPVAWNAALATLLTPHFIAARTFIPALAEAGTRYLFIGGGAATRPVLGATLVSIAGAAQIMLVRALVAERPDRASPIIQQLSIDGPVATNAAHHGPETPGEITAREVGEVAANMLHDGTTGSWPNVQRDGPLVTIRAKT
jgi:3-oxoacyl-[acyl-carrier protein] reductase